MSKKGIESKILLIFEYYAYMLGLPTFLKVLSLIFRWIKRYFWRDPVYHPRTISIGEVAEGFYPKNLVRNQKYNCLTFVPFVLFEQFKFFLNFFFLCIALSQFIEALRIGSLIAYWGPLVSRFLMLHDSSSNFKIFIGFCTECYIDSRRIWRFFALFTWSPNQSSRV